MRKPASRIAAAAAAALALGIGSAVWVTSSASAAPASPAGAPTAALLDVIPPVCTAGDLAVWVSYDAMNGAAGTWYYPLEFTNTSDAACRTWGWPGVSAANASGGQLGRPAARDSLYSAGWVSIPAGGTAHALLGYGAAVVSSSGCDPRDASTLKVYVPGATTADHAFFDFPVCTVTGSHTYLEVSVIRAGANL